MNRIIFTYDTAADSLRLDRSSDSVVPVFDPADIMDTLRGLSKSGQTVESVTQVKLSNRRAYRMEVASDESRKQLKVVLTEISE